MKTALVALAALLAFVAGGCSDDSEPGDAASSSSSSSAPSDAATTGVISPELPADPTFADKASGVIADLDVTSCDTQTGDVEARGTITNSARTARDLVVTVSWTVGSTGDVVAKGIATLPRTSPGLERRWVVRATVPGDATPACVPSAQSGRLER